MKQYRVKINTPWMLKGEVFMPGPCNGTYESHVGHVLLEETIEACPDLFEAFESNVVCIEPKEDA